MMGLLALGVSNAGLVAGNLILSLLLGSQLVEEGLGNAVR